MTDRSLTEHFPVFVNQDTPARPKARIRKIAQDITVVIWDAKTPYQDLGS